MNECEFPIDALIAGYAAGIVTATIIICFMIAFVKVFGYGSNRT